MKKAIKILLFILFLFALSILWPNIVTYQAVAGLKGLEMPQTYPLIGQYMPHYLFWGSIALAAILLIAYLIFLFSPSAKAGVELTDNQEKGQLVVKPSAIEGLVQSILASERAVEQASTKATIYDKRIDVDIKGQIARTSGLYGQGQEIARRIQSEINDLLGQDYPAGINVTFKDIARNDRGNVKSSQARVI